MSATWFYIGVEHATEALADAAVLNMKSRLDNNPTDWVIVKEISGSAAAGWVVPAVSLSDSEINNIDATKTYSVSSVNHSDNDLGLTSSQVTAKVAQHRAAYASHLNVNIVVRLEEVPTGEGDLTEPVETRYAPTNADMSGY